MTTRRAALAARLFATFLAAAMLGALLTAGHMAYRDQPRVSRPATTPTVEWADTDAREFPGCQPKVVTADTLVVVLMDGTRRKMSLDAAWERNTNNNDADNLWVVGSCPAATWTTPLGTTH